MTTTTRIGDLLSKRQTLVCWLLLQNLSRQSISEVLGISVRTVEAHIGDAFYKLGVSSTPELVLGLWKGYIGIEPGVARYRLRRTQASPTSFLCPLCGRRTYHPQDVANEYCPCCGNDLLPKPGCGHRPLPAPYAVLDG